MDTEHISDTTNEPKAEIYEAMAVINRSFEQIISALYKLETKGVVSDDFLQDQEIITSELWARMNCHILALVTIQETDDRDHYGKMRATIERRIRGRQ
ncbi:MAG: hypothetical protein ACHP79_01725 [Terriglobales bacterium]